FERKWAVNGAIREIDIPGSYYLDPRTQDATQRCLTAIFDSQLVLLPGARASGKTTRLLCLREELRAKGYKVLYISFEGINMRSAGSFWVSLGAAAKNAASTGHFKFRPNLSISSQEGFLEYFLALDGRHNVVLLVDEFSELYRADPVIQQECLRAFREIRNNNEIYAIRSIISAGTFSILYLNPTDSIISPFNVADHIPNPHFTLEEVKRLFLEFAHDNYITIDDGVVEDVWAKSNGHPGMVCLCGRIIFNNLQSLLDDNSKTVMNHTWQQFPADWLYNELFAYNTFRAMLDSLSSSNASPAVALLRSYFLGFLGDVEINNGEQEKFVDFLTSEGVLLKPSASNKYRMASPLIDGLIRTRLIPLLFPLAPRSAPLCHDDGKSLHILNTLIKSLEFFDKDLICLARFRSYKTPMGKPVPRESIYDTELMRILSNWLQQYGWMVTGQWHLQTDLNKHKFSDIVIKKNDWTVVLELLATGTPSSIKSHIQKTAEYKELLSANEAWVIHFTCEDNYEPTWQSDAELLSGINVIHFAHSTTDFTNVLMSTHWKDHAGNTQQEDNRLLEV
ncbi:hypothetical protein BYT27DRAFT_7087461, partial [Phlegmacium glaucopus]